MYRDFLAAIAERPRARDEPRARDRRSAADGPRVREPSTDGVMRTERYDIVIIGSGAGGGTMAHALADSPARDPHPRARRLRPAGRRELEPRRGLEAPALPDDGALARRARPGIPSVHALLRRRQHQVLGQRAVPPAPRGLSGRSSTWTASRPAWPIDYDTLAPYYDRAERLYHVHGEQGIDPTEPPRGPFPYRAVPHAAAMATIVEQLRAQGLHPSPLPLGIRDGCVLCNTCNSFPCKIHAKSDADVCCVRPATRAAERDAVDQRVARRLLTEPGRRQGRGRRSRAQRRDGARRGVARRRVVRRGQLGGAAAAIGERQASERAREFVGPRRPPLHGAPGDDDAGVSSVPEERHGVSEDRRDQRFLFARAEHDVSARPDPVAGPHARRDGADGGAADAAVGRTNAWVARGVDWLAMSEDLPRRGQPRHARRRTAGFGCTTGRTT